MYSVETFFRARDDGNDYAGLDFGSRIVDDLMQQQLEVDGESTQHNGYGNGDAETTEPDTSARLQPDIPPATQPSASQSAKSSKTPRICGQWTSSGLPVDY
ncbi:hypothetical protein E4U17_007611 [Claviceps sp. LM77 group G4]|nr:hypothetical protein E4U17_007611 [Claviceps sp. LM77 group G4]KAG6084337.1 hypothetical protein E4U16_002147 [Claviceps sp. LM84 group G4]